MPVKKQKAGSGPHIRKRTTNPPLRFSFQFFGGRDAEMCPGSFREGYTRALMERLRDLSGWTVQQFTSCNDKSVHAHTHDWAETARPDGFSNLNDHYSGYPGW